MESIADRGRLLYEEEWAKTKRFHDRSHIVMGSILMVMCFMLAIIMGWAFLAGDVSDPGMAALMMSVVVGMLFFMSFGMLAAELKRVPFRMYERGFTLPNVTLSKGWRRQDEFIGWERLDAVRLEEQVYVSINVKKITLAYDGTKTLDLSMGLLEEPFAAMKALNLLVPAKMDEKFRAYLGPDEERKVVRYPLPESDGRSWAWLMPVFIELMIGVMLGTFGWSLLVAGRLSGVAIFGALFGVMSVVFFWMLLTVDDQNQTERMRKKAAATEAGVVVPATGIGRIARNVRPAIPYAEIRVIRTTVEPLFFSHQAELETFGGEKFKVPYQVYEAASRRKEFRYEYFEYINKGPALPAGKVMPRSWPGTLGLFVLFCSPVLLAPLINVDLSGQMELVQPLLMSVVFSVLLPLLSVAMWMMSRRQRLGEGLVATRERITISGAPARFGDIPRGDFVSARIARDVWTLHCEITTVKGRVKVGYSAADKLLLAGYPVEGAENLTPLASLAPGRPAEAADEAKKPAHARLGPGKLLAEQDPAAFQAFRQKNLRRGIVLTAIGLAMFGVPFLLDVDAFLVLNLMVIVMMPLLFGLLFIALGVKTRPARIYENGIVVPDGNRKEGEVFVPYGRIKGFADLDAPLTGAVVRLQIEGGFYNLPRSFPDFNVLFEEMKRKFGKPEYDSADFQQFTDRTFRTIELGVYAFALVLGYCGGAVFASMNGFFLPRSFLGKTLMYGAPLVLLITAYGLHFLEFRKHNYPGKADLRKAGALFCAALVLFLAGWFVNIPDPDRTTIYAPEVPGSWAPLNGSIENESREMRANISVQPGERLVIRNSTITFPLTERKEFRFFVSEGGSLEVTDSLIRSNSSEFGLKFSIYGGALLQNSTFTGLYASPWYKNGVGGLEIFNSSVSVIGCSIVDNRYNGMLVVHSSPLVENCNISGNGDDGIEMQDASPVIRGCRLLRNDWAIIVHPYCSPRIEGNIIEDNDHGITIEGSSPVIVNNTFSNNRAWAVKYYDDSHPRIEDNVFTSNEANIVVATTMESYFALCAAVVTAVGVLAVAIVLARIWKKRRAEETSPGS